LASSIYDPYTINTQTAQRQLINPGNPYVYSRQPHQPTRPSRRGHFSAGESAGSL
jgi:hypothetical protein